MWRWCSRSWANGGCAWGWRRCSDRRLVAPALLRRYLADGPRDLTAAVACRTAAERLGQLFADLPGGLEPFLRSGPIGHPQFALLAADIARW